MGNGIEHFLSPTAGSAQQVLCRLLAPGEAHRLLNWGAVYLKGKRATAASRVGTGDWLRVHRRPKRFFPAGGRWTPWWSLGPDFVVAYKPAGIPMHPSLDNLWENLQTRLEQQLEEKLYTAGRLDVATQGLVALGRGPDFIRRFHRDRAGWEKTYRALLPCPVPTGRHTHFMDRSQRPPYRLTQEAGDTSVPCSLTVRNVRPTAGYYEAEIVLETGRTHQIRAQMAALGAPLVGDRLYAQGEGDPRWIGLQCASLAFEGNRFEWDTRPWNEK